MATPKETFLGAVKARIAGDRKHGWGVEDSLSVIKALHKSETGEDMDDAVAGYVKQVINPSAFRQGLEDAGVLDKTPRKLSGTLADLAGMQK